MPAVFLIHQDPVAAKVFRDALSSGSSFQLAGHATSAAEGLAKLGTARADLVFVQIALPDGDGISVIGQIQKKFPSIYCAPILQGGESGEVWQKILQLGLRDVLVAPLNPQKVLEACRQAESNAAAAAQQPSTGPTGGAGYVVTVASARGGVGKSIFATNLAVALARRGHGTTLVDLSMSPGDFFTMLDQVPRHTMADAIGQGMGLDATLLRNLIAEHALGFNFLACPNEDFDFYSFDIEQARNLVRTVRELNEFVVIDTGVYDLPPTNAAVEEADLVYLLSTRDLARLLATQRLYKSYLSRGVGEEKVKVIISNAEVGMEITDTEVEEVLGRAVTAYLPSVPAETAFSINSGKPLMQGQPEHPLSAVIDKLAELTAIKWDETQAA